MKVPIAIVDDDDGVRAVIASSVAAEGYEPLTFPDAESLLAALEQGTTPALFLLDIMMPRMDGFELCAALRAKESLADVPIVFLTAMSEAQAEKRAVSVGIDDVLTKPVRRSELAVRIRSLLRYAAGKRALRDAYHTAQVQNAELAAAAERQRELAAMIVHDLKNPLAALHANLRYCSRVIDQPNTLEAVKETIDDALEVDEMILRRVATILDLARNASGRLLSSAQDVTLANELERIAQRERRRAEYRQVSLVVRCEETLTVSADRDLLRRMLENVTDNALRFAEEGSEITMNVERRSDAVVIEVTNASAGLDPAARERLFTSFAAPPSVDADDVLHVGLGLAFCRMAARAQGAQMELFEREGRKVVARITFPVVQ